MRVYFFCALSVGHIIFFSGAKRANDYVEKGYVLFTVPYCQIFVQRQHGEAVLRCATPSPECGCSALLGCSAVLAERSCPRKCLIQYETWYEKREKGIRKNDLKRLQILFSPSLAAQQYLTGTSLRNVRHPECAQFFSLRRSAGVNF